ncbi:MAG: DUF4136 domain-containing protein [Polymorphobacter sp.]|uniref:DUF4136 domain-containing protein n=1 Tax=Polymorphobacter sp. TaxID=1909290 RepID=UPI003A8416A3
MRSPVFILAALVLGGCVSSPPMADVTRFHLGQPISRGTVQVVAPPTDIATELNIRAASAAIATELEGLGFRPVDTASSVYVATFRVDETSQQGPPKQSPFSVGIGAATGGRNVGIGGSVNVPVGRDRPGDTIRTTLLILDIRTRDDAKVVWEGRASRITNAKAENPLPGLARALFAGFPGPSGQMVQVPTQ